GLVGEVELLGDDAVQPLASQPAPRRRGRAGGLAEAKRRPAGDLADERLQRVAPLGEGAAGQVLAAAGEQIEGDKPGRAFARELLDAAGRRVQAELQRLEAAAGDDDLAVEHPAALRERRKARGEFGEVALERFLVLRLEPDSIGPPVSEAAKAVKFGLELPVVARGQRVDRL